MSVVLFATPGMAQGVVDAAAPLRAAGHSVHYIPIQGLSRVFVAEAQRLRQPGGRLLPALIRKYAPGVDPGASVMIVGFSAGCWMWREGVSAHPRDREQVDGVICIDGLHATEAQLSTTRSYLDEGGRMLVIHSDTPTHGYPSTTETVRTLGEHAGLTVRHSPGGHAWSTLRAPQHIARWINDTRADDLAPPPRTWLGDSGPGVLAYQAHLRARGLYDGPIDGEHGPVTERAAALAMTLDYQPLLDEPLAMRRLHWCGYQLGLDPREIIGAGHHPLILHYSRHCRRGGAFLGVDRAGEPQWDGGFALRAPSDEWAWCAIAMSASLHACILPGEVPPHGLRVAVHELVTDARQMGTFRAAGAYRPRPGDLAISARVPGESPLRGGRGHVEIVTSVEADGRVGLLGGNEAADGRTHGGRWRFQLEPSRKVVGWITSG